MVFIFGNDYSLTIVMPFVFIIIGLVFFLTVYLKDNISRFRFRRKSRENKVEKEHLDIHHEFLNLKKQLPHLSTQELLDSITFITKRFIGEKLGISHEFTFEELPRNKMDWQVIEFTKRLSDLKYSGRDITKDEINHLVLYLSKILNVKSFEEKRHDEPHRIFPRVIFPRFPKIEFRLPHLKKHHESHPEIYYKEHKPIRINIRLPKKIVIDPFGFFRWIKMTKAPKIELKIPHQKREAVRKSIYEVKKQSLSHISRAPHRKIRSALYKLLKIISKEEDNLSNLEGKSLKRFIKGASLLSREFSRREDEEGYNTISSIRNLLSYAKIEHEIPQPPKPVKKAIKHHRHRLGMFERIRANLQASKILKLIRKAERKSLKYPLISKKLYDEAFMMYYKLPIDREEDIAIKLDRFYEKIHADDQRELIKIKHNNLKVTKEAMKHLTRYRNYIVLENADLGNNLRRSMSELKKKVGEHVTRTRSRKVKSRLHKLLKAMSDEEAGVFSLEERSIDRLFRKAYSLLKEISMYESKEGHDTYNAVRSLFSHLKMEHKLPKHDYIEVKIPKNFVPIDVPEPIEKVEIGDVIKESVEEPLIMPIKLRAPEIKVIPRVSKISIEPPKIPEKRISERMRKLIEEKENVYSKLKQLEEKELDRFKHTRRMTMHEDIGYHDFIRSIKPRVDAYGEEHKIKKLFEAK